MGHAGAVVLHPDGTLEGAHDPRADGGAAGVSLGQKSICPLPFLLLAKLRLPSPTRGEGTATAAALSEAMEHSELF